MRSKFAQCGDCGPLYGVTLVGGTCGQGLVLALLTRLGQLEVWMVGRGSKHRYQDTWINL